MKNQIKQLTDAIHRLGLNGASTQMGAIETLAFEIKSECERREEQDVMFPRKIYAAFAMHALIVSGTEGTPEIIASIAIKYADALCVAEEK